jgi:hypothetical protein
VHLLGIISGGDDKEDSGARNGLSNAQEAQESMRSDKGSGYAQELRRLGAFPLP